MTINSQAETSPVAAPENVGGQGSRVNRLTALLEKPETQAALISAGLSLMTPMPPGMNFAGAVGRAGQAAAGSVAAKKAADAQAAQNAAELDLERQKLAQQNERLALERDRLTHQQQVNPYNISPEIRRSLVEHASSTAAKQVFDFVNPWVAYPGATPEESLPILYKQILTQLLESFSSGDFDLGIGAGGTGAGGPSVSELGLEGPQPAGPAPLSATPSAAVVGARYPREVYTAAQTILRERLKNDPEELEKLAELPPEGKIAVLNALIEHEGLAGQS